MTDKRETDGGPAQAARPTLAELVAGNLAALDAAQAEAWMAQAGPGQMAEADLGRFTVSRGIAVMPVRGILTPNSEMLERWLGWSTYRGIEETCDTLAGDEDVNAIVMMLDCPGGMVLGLDAATQAVARLAAVKPVHALVDPLAASAAYWIASQASDITATPGSWVGSIGTMTAGQAPIQPGSSGWQAFQLRSQHALGKNADLSDEAARAIEQGQIDAAEAAFHAAVAAGRGIPLDDLPARLSADGDPTHGGIIYTPADALARGLIDAQMTRGAFMAGVVDLYAPPTRPRTGAIGASARARAALASATT